MFPLGRHRDHIVPADEIRQRIANLQALLCQKNLALAWIDHLTDRYYFTGSVQDGTLLVPAVGEPEFHVRKSQARARSESPLLIVPFAGRTGLIARAASLLGKDGRVGVPLDVMPAPAYLWLMGKLGAAPVDIGADVRLLKAVKSAWEITQIRVAAEQGTAVLAEVPELLHAGMTELELSAEVERRLRLRGHPGPLRIRRPGLELGMLYAVSGDGGLYPTNFDGPDGAEGLYPGGASGSGLKLIATGETVMVDMVSSFNGYQADTTRVFCVGHEAPPSAQRAHRLCMDVLARLVANLRPGRICFEIYEETLAWAEQQGLPEGFMGFQENRVKFFGHGVGLDLDEFPIIAPKIELPLVAGMVVALEPKAFLAGIGPVGVENTYVVTERGGECLCPLPQEIVCVG